MRRHCKGLLPQWEFPPLLRFLDPHNLEAIVAANVAYLLVIFSVVQWVKRSGPVKDALVKPFMLFYNLSCVALAGTVVVGVVRYKLSKFGTEYGGFVCNPPELGTRDGETVAWYIWLYYAQKYWEYLDTLIFAMRGSLRQLSFLHVYHHVRPSQSHLHIA